MAPEATTFELGRFLVRIGIRADNPYFPVFLVFYGARLIGRQFSRPSQADCEWLERENGHAAEAERSASLTEKRRIAATKGRARRLRNDELEAA